MGKKQVGSSVGLLALVALLAHMFGESPESRPADIQGFKKEKAGGLSKGKKAAARAFGSEGPWLATQQYFHREAEVGSAGKCRPYLLPEPGKRESQDCNTAALNALYGMDAGFKSSQITSLIATVPDPLHTRMSLGTDRVLDAIQQAAYNARWEFATQWLPWTAKAEGAGSASEGGASFDLEKLPGLIVFRRHFTEAALENQLLLVFVVGETPTAGINGFQFEVARRSLFTLGSEQPGRVAVLGPNFSGSFQSLTHLIESDQRRQSYEIRSGSVGSSKYAASMIDALSEKQIKVSFHGSTIPSQSFVNHFEDLVGKWGYRKDQAAELVEDESGFSFSYAKPITTDDPKRPIATYRYPRDIAQLRNAYSDIAFARTAKQEGTPPPALESSLKDTQSGEDVFPIFSSSHTAVSQNAVLEQVVRALKRDKVRVVSLSSTNIFDTLFLSKVLARYCPDTRIVLSGADLLFVENATQGSLTGVMAISPFPLFPAGEAWANPKLNDITTFPDADSEGEYNAAMTLLNGPVEKKRAFEPVFGRGSSQLFSAWLLVLGRSGWYPVSLIGQENIPLRDKNIAGEETNWFDQVNKAEPLTPLPALTEGWTALCIGIGILSIGFCARVSYLRHHPRLLVWSSLCLIDLPSAGCPQAVTKTEHLRYLCLFSCLGALTFIAGIPLMPMIAACRVYGALAGNWKAGSLVFLVLLAVGAPVGTAIHLMRLVPVRVRSEKLGGFDGPSRVMILLRGVMFITPLAGLAFWEYCCADGTNGWLLCFRALTLSAPVCPVWPLLLGALAFFTVAFFHLRRFTWGDRQRPLLNTQVFDDALWGQFRDLKKRLDCVLGSPASALRTSGLPIVRLCLVGFIVLLVFLFPSDTLRSFEPRAFELLFLGMLLPVIAGMALTFAQFATCWSTIRAFLATLNSVALGRFVKQMPDFGGSGPVWLRHVKLMSLATSVNSSIALHNLEIERESDDKYGSRYWTALQSFLSSQEAGRDRREFIDQYAQFRQTAAEITDALGRTVLKSYWAKHEIAFVDSEEPEPEGKTGSLPRVVTAPKAAMAAGAGYGSFSARTFTPAAAAATNSEDAPVSEEAYKLASKYVALQYAAFIGYALRHLQNLLLCCMVGFVLLVLALSSFSFQAPQAISQFLIVALVVGGAVILVVLAQLEKDAVLSRLSGTKEGELGKDFYIRAFTYGAVPVLAVLGTRFPAIANILSTWAEPTLSAMR